MKLRIQRQDLVKALFLTQGITGKRSDRPILTHILLKTVQGRVQMVATDRDITLYAYLKADIEEEGSVAIPAKQAYAIAKSLPEEQCVLELSENHSVRIQSGGSEFNLVGLWSEEYPNLSIPPVEGELSFQVSTLQDMVDSTLFCVSSDENRHNLSGIYCEKIDDTTLRFVATDGHRLALRDKNFDTPLELSRNAIIPKKSFHELKRVLTESSPESAMTLGFAENHVVFTLNDIVLTSRLVEGQFPAYRQVIPEEHQRTVKVAKQPFVEALKRVSLVTQHRAYAVRMNLSDGNMELMADDRMFGSAKENIPIEYKYDAMSIGFNARYILDAISHISDEGLLIELSDDLSPGVLKPVDRTPFLAVIMPMRI